MRFRRRFVHLFLITFTFALIARPALLNATEHASDHGTSDEEDGPIVRRPRVTSGPAPKYNVSSTASAAHADEPKKEEAKTEGDSDHAQHETAKHEPAEKPTRKPASEAKAETRATDAHDSHDETSSAATAHAAPAATTTTAPTVKAKPSAHGEATDSVSAEKSLTWLKNGNARYLKRNFRSDGRSPKDRERLASGQKPHAIVLSCSDSRVPPEIVFDQALGEIFVIRVAGEALDSSVVASIEYAVEHLGSKLIVVMGHTQCGAVKAALSVKEGDTAGSQDLDNLLSGIRPHLKTVQKDAPSTNFEIESAVNADGVARDLVKRSELIRKKVDAGEIMIKTALYRLDSGKVSFY